MTQWDGRGLPPTAAGRIARAQASSVRTSLLSTDATASLQAVGLDPVGEVMGCIAQNIRRRGDLGCGQSVGRYGSIAPFATGKVTATKESRWAAFRPYADAMRHGYHTAVDRLRQEATALGADGVVDIRLSLGVPDGDVGEFMALGTAVRARSTVRPERLFTTNLPGGDVAKLMQGGWVPVGLTLGFEVALRHDDIFTRAEAASWVNTEVTGYSELTQRVRQLVRADVRHQLSGLGADGFVGSALQLTVSQVKPERQHRDHVAEALLVGTAVAQFPRPAPASRYFPAPPRLPRPPALTVLPLAPMTSTRRTRP